MESGWTVNYLYHGVVHVRVSPILLLKSNHHPCQTRIESCQAGYLLEFHVPGAFAYIIFATVKSILI